MLDLQTAAHALTARHTGANVVFTGVSTDTRSIRPGDLFVALRGERFDGHVFLDAAFAAGAVAAMVDERAHVVRPVASLLMVADTRLALGRLAATWRERFTLPVIGVTGSNGKTTVKEMLAAVLREAAGEDGVLATAGNLNNDIGMPLTLLQLRSQHRFAVIEMGMNHLGEIRYLTQLARPDVALVNNAGTAHIGEVGSREAIARAKGEIYEGLRPGGVALVNTDDDFAELWREMNAGRRVIDFGIERPAAISAQYELSGDGTLVTVRTPQTQYLVRLGVPGAHNVRNALAVLAIIGVLGLSRRKAAQALTEFNGTGRRFELRGEVNGISIFDDYAHHPTEIRATLAGARARFPNARIWAVWQPHTYSRTQTLFLDFARAFKDADKVIVTEVYAAREPEQDFTSAEIVSAMPHLSACYIKTLPEVADYLLENLQSGDVVLVLSAGDADEVSTNVLKGLQSAV